MKYSSLALLLLALLSLNSCSSTRKSRGASDKGMTASSLMKRMEKQRLSPEWFESRMRIDYADEDMSVSASATLKMKKDSLLWLSVKKLGFEIARVQVTQDSVYVVDRFNKEYTVEGLAYLAESYGLPAGSLTELQDFILGNPVFFGSDELGIEPLGPTYRLKGGSTEMSAEYLVGTEDFLLKKMAFKVLRNEQEMRALLEGYEDLEGKGKFSYIRNLMLESKYSGQANVTLQFSNVELNVPKTIRFDIPSRYTRAK
jgi:outer membrane biogenesis lipoprotein LolB